MLGLLMGITQDPLVISNTLVLINVLLTVDLPFKNVIFANHNVQWKYQLFLAIFHSYITVYQRVKTM